MRVSEIELTNWKKHRKAHFEFPQGSTVIQGKNYSGKSSILQAILVGLLGNSAVAAPVKTLVSDGAKDFILKLTLLSPVEGKSVCITRTSKDSSITRLSESEPYARGHTAVNAEVLRLMALDKSTFMKVFTSEQGSPQQLLLMEGAELQKFIESVAGLDKLDEMNRLANKEVMVSVAEANVFQSYMMSPDTLEEAIGKVGQLVVDLEKLEEALDSLEKNREAAVAKRAVEAEALKKLEAANILANKWLNERASLCAQLDTIPQMDVVETKMLEVRLAEKTATKEKLREQMGEASLLNNEINFYEKMHGEWTAELDKIGVLTFVPEEEVQASSARSAAIRKYLNDQDKLQAMHTSHEISIKDVEERLADLKLSLLDVGAAKPLEDPTNLENARDVAKQERETMIARVDFLEKSIHDATCPTCHRPFDQAFSLEEMEEELKASNEKLEALYSNFIEASDNLEKFKERITAAQEHNSKVEYFKMGISQAEKMLEESKASKAALDEPADAETLVTALAESKKLDLEVEVINASNTRNKVLLDQQTALRSKLNGLKKPEGARVDMAPLHEGLKVIEAELSSVATELTTVQANNATAKANNDKRWELKVKLKEYPIEETPTVTDTAPIVATLETLQGELDQYATKIRETNAEHIEVRLALNPLKAELDHHREAEGKFTALNKKAEVYRFLATLISNSRTSFMEKAQATIFQVATEFAQMCTGKDIEEVLVHEGNISYKEGGIIRAKSCASGAQKSIIGLGMKLGVANLITSDFDTLLLDEISADMDEEISFNCMSSLSSLFPNSITVSHRAMDTAGNVVMVG